MGKVIYYIKRMSVLSPSSKPEMVYDQDRPLLLLRFIDVEQAFQKTNELQAADKGFVYFTSDFIEPASPMRVRWKRRLAHRSVKNEAS
jgi:hypothetical protein